MAGELKKFTFKDHKSADCTLKYVVVVFMSTLDHMYRTTYFNFPEYRIWTFCYQVSLDSFVYIWPNVLEKYMFVIHFVNLLY